MTTERTIRQAELEDIERCLALDASYTTDEVWQLRLDDASPAGTSSEFRRVRLTRTVQLPFPRTEDELRALWHNDVTDVLVAGTDEDVAGFVDLTAQSDHESVWIYNLVVNGEQRRNGIGTQLLHAAARWADARGFRRLLLETPTKNGPALRFFFAHGATFCGFHDRYYSNQDIAVFFEYRI